MKKISYLFTIITGIFFTIFLFSCSKEGKNDIDATIADPKIENIELGEKNSKIGEIGEELHLEATLTVEGNIEEVKLEITYQGNESSSFNVKETFPNLKGLKGGNIHKHFDIPTDAKEGNYNFSLSITDQKGKRVEIKEILKLEKKYNFSENEALSFSILQLGVLNKSIGMKKDDFVALLTSHNISYEWTDDFEPQLIYYAEKEMEAFKKYKVTVSFEDIFDLDLRPYQRYKGVGSIIVVPVDNANESLQSKNVVENITFLDKYISSFANKAYRYRRFNDDKNYDYAQFTKEQFYHSLSKEELGSAAVYWNRNPNALAENSSKAKNTPKITLNYEHETQTYNISIEFNRPEDFHKYLKNN